MNYLNFALLFTAIFNLYSCGGSGEANLGFSSSTGGVSILSFTGIDSIDQVTDASARINWTETSKASAYQIYNVTSNPPEYLATVIPPDTSYTVSNLSKGTNYKFKVIAVDANLNISTQTTTKSITTNLAPPDPKVEDIDWIAPVTPSGIEKLVTFEVEGIRAGLAINIYDDSSCSTLLASATAVSGTNSITIPLAVGAHNLYIKTNNGTYSSDCIDTNISYEALPVTCPSEFVLVPANADLGVNEFCIMKYEAKNVGGVATSQAANQPWATISAQAAKDACQALGANYDIVSNAEWMSMARNIEATAFNWSSGTVGIGVLAKGHSDRYNGSLVQNVSLAVTDTADPYCGTDNASTDPIGSGDAPNSGWEQRRTFRFSNGEEVWDLAGNLWEIVEWTSGGTSFNTLPYSCGLNSGLEFSLNPTCGYLENNDFMPGNPGNVDPSVYNSAYNLGRFYFSGTIQLKGGFFTYYSDEHQMTGIYGTYAGWSSTTGNTSGFAGFRCLYRP